MIADVIAEKAIIGCLLSNDSSAYFNVSELLNSETFTNTTYSSLYYVISEIFENYNDKPDIQLVYSKVRSNGYDNFISINDIKSCIDDACASKSIIDLASKIRKLQILRLIQNHLRTQSKKVEDFTGEEAVSEILSLSEIDFSSLLSEERNVVNLGDKARSFIENIIENPIEQIGISSGYNIYDHRIGGGLRPGSVNVIAARTKVGKSIICNNIAYNVSKNFNIPVLYIDTELREEDQLTRIFARVSEIDTLDIETGKFTENNYDFLKVQKAIEEIEKVRFYHVSVAGLTIEEQMGILIRWIRKNIKQNADGSWEKFLIIYDYIKLPSAKDITHNISEYQALGFVTTALHNLSMRYDCPIVAAAQANRDALTKEDTGVIGGSDRIAQMCTSISLIKEKTAEEIQIDGEKNGNLKLKILATRYGSGMDEWDYINLARIGAHAHIKEIGTTGSQLAHDRNTKTQSTMPQQN